MQKSYLTRIIAGVLSLCLALGTFMPLSAAATDAEVTDVTILPEATVPETSPEGDGADGEDASGENSIAVLADDESLFIDSYADFVLELKQLEVHAADYAATSGKNAGELLLNFLRTGVDRYNDSNWKTLAGEEITEFTDYVAAQDAANGTTVMRLRNIEQFTIPNGQEVDFGHMFGTMNIAYKASSVYTADLGGWAGDICDLMLYSKDYGNVPAGTIDEMAAYIKANCFGVDADDAFGMDDFYGDMDALYLNAQMKAGKTLSAVMEEYFTASQTDKARAEYFLKNRFDGLYTSQSVRDAVYNAYVGNVGLQVLESGRGLADEAEIRQASCYAFADYVYELAGDTLEEPTEPEDPEQPDEVDNPYYSVFSSTSSVLAPGISQSINYAQTADGKQIVYYVATVDVTREDVTIKTNYRNNDPSQGWGMQRVEDQAAAMMAKYGDPESDQYIENFSVVVATNGAGYNMSTGKPSGLLVMNGEEWTPVNGDGFFAILKDGSAMIGTQADYVTYKDQIWDGISAFGHVLIKDGEVVAGKVANYVNTRASRTAIGIKADGSVVMMVLDGRQEPFSAGGSIEEIAQIMLDAGCVEAVNLDGGGSSTYLSKPEGSDTIKLVNRPSDGYARSVAASLVAISTAKSSKEFDHANITSEYDYLTIGTSLQMEAGGVSNTGNSAPLPEDAAWQVSDEAIGSITADGVFTAADNGEVEVQLVSGGQIVGSKTLNVVVPDNIGFEKDSMNVVYGVPVELPVVLYYNGNPVAFNGNDVFVALTNADAGTVEGLVFTASDEYGIRSVSAGAILMPTGEKYALINLTAYRADEAFFDFDNVTAGTRQLAWNREVSNATTQDNVVYQIEDMGKAMDTSYTFALDMESIEIPPQLEDLTYMLPGADAGSTAWDFLLSLAERVSVLTEVTITARFDQDLDVDISGLTVSNDYFYKKTATLDEDNVLTLVCGWHDQTQAIDPATANPICILSGIKATPKEGAAWDQNNRLEILNNGEVTYRIYLRASSLYAFACQPANQIAYGLVPYSAADLIYNDGPEQGAYFGTTYAEFEDTYTLDKTALQGWHEVDGKLHYYVNHVMVRNCTVELPGQEDSANKYFFVFDEEGNCTGKANGLVDIGGSLYYTINGEAKTGWQTVVNEQGEVDYYFFNTWSRKAVDGALKINGYNYVFEDCVLKKGELVTNATGTRYMWAGGWASQQWLEIDGKIAYACSSGYFADGLQYRYSPEGDWTYYAFSDDGWWMKDFSGIYDWNGGTYLIKEGIVTDYPGLFEWEGDYYYISSTNVLVKDRFYWISKTNGIVPEGRYQFDAEGKLVREPNTPDVPDVPDVPDTPVEPDKNGIVAEEGTFYYYVNGVRNYAGVIYLDGYYYYVRTSGEVINNRNYWITKTNGLIPEKSYTFDAQGRITNPPSSETPDTPDVPDVPDTPVGPAKNGIVEEGGVLYYYVDGVRTYAGLIYLDGYYYYVRTSGQLAQSCKYWPTKTNGLLTTTRQYTFDDQGRMTDCDFDETVTPPSGETPDAPENPAPVKNGIVAEDGSLFYYVNNVRTYAGLICIDGNWYYVRTSGELAHDVKYWPTKTNGYMKTTKQYYFDSNGVMQDPPAELLEATV